METNSLKATAWALTTRAELMALVAALEQYFQAHDTGNQFEQRVTYNYLTDCHERARNTLNKGTWRDE